MPAVPTREDALRSTPPTRSRAFRERFVVDDDGPHLRRRQLARPPAARDRRAPHARSSSEWGERLVSGWPDWIELPRADRRPARRARPRRAARRGARLRQRHRQPLQARRRGAAAEPGPIVGARRRLPDRPLRPRGARRAARRRAAARRPRDAAADAAARALVVPLARRLPLRRGRRPARITARARHGARPLGPQPRRRRDRARPARQRRRPRRRLHLQVPQRRARRARRSSTCARTSSAELRSPIQGWFGQRDQFAMGAALRPGAGHRALPRRHAADPRPRRRRGAASSSSPRPAMRARSRPRRARSPTLFVELHDEWLAPLGFTLGSPRDAARARRPRRARATPTAGGSAAR